MRTINLIAVVLTVTLGMSVVHAAEGQERGGGDAVKVGSGWGLLDLNESLPFDYFNPTPAPKSYWYDSGPEREPFDRVLGAFLALDKCSASFSITVDKETRNFLLKDVASYLTVQWNYIAYGDYGAMERAYPFLNSKFGDQLVWIATQTPLENIPDEGVVRLADPSGKQQLAVQKDGVVMVYKPIFDRLDARNKAALVLHEALLRMVLKINPSHYQKYGTSKIRELVKLVFSENWNQLPDSAVNRVCGPNSGLFK